MLLKADLHVHAREDKKESDMDYSTKEFIDAAVNKGYNVVSFTFHEQYFWDEEIVKYAHQKGILLIPGSEAKIQGKEVLLYNFTKHELLNIKTFKDLKHIKKDHHLVIAPHPYFIKGSCLGNMLEKNIDLFDAIEYSHFYTKNFNLNKKGENIAKKYNKPVIATSDCHLWIQFGNSYTIIDAEKNIDSIIHAIKKGKVKMITKPLTTKNFRKILLWSLFSLPRKIMVILRKTYK